jgi:four helix bundle protein
MQPRQTTFEDLAIYQHSLKLAHEIYLFTQVGPFARDRGLKDQIRRASVSVMSNIAEGFERGSNTEFIQFLYISKGSCGEVRAQVRLAHLLNYVDTSKYQHLVDSCRTLSGMIENMISSLKNTQFRGTKFRYVRPD